MSSRIKNQLIAKVITRFPRLAQRFITAYEPWESGEPPSSQFSKLRESARKGW